MKIDRVLMSTGLSAALVLAGCGKPPAPPEEIRAVRTVVVEASPVSGRNTYAGEIRPRFESNLGFRVAGKIEQRKVNVGDRVAKGDLLLKLDARDLALTEASSRATVTAQEAQFAVEKADFDRYAKLVETGFISAAEFDRQKTRFAAAQAQLESVRAQARVSGNQTGYAQLAADADGTISAIEAEVGQVVAAGQTVIRLAHAGAMEVAADVPEQLIKDLKTGQPVQILIASLSAEPLPGRIRELAASADPATRTYSLRATIDAPPPGMRLGMTASMRIPNASAPAQIHLPLAAYVQQNGVHGVWVFDPAASAVDFRPVKLIGFDGNEVLIGDGVKVGERVVTAGAPLLSAGQKVKLATDAPASSR